MLAISPFFIHVFASFASFPAVILCAYLEVSVLLNHTMHKIPREKFLFHKGNGVPWRVSSIEYL